MCNELIHLVAREVKEQMIVDLVGPNDPARLGFVCSTGLSGPFYQGRCGYVGLCPRRFRPSLLC
jgi:hypothetical protein